MRSIGRLAARHIPRTYANQATAVAQPTAQCLVPTAPDDLLGFCQALARSGTWLGIDFSRQLHSSAAMLAAQNIVVPSMGDSITEGTIVNVSKSKGDAVKEDEVIAQIETDKVTIDVRAPGAGTLTDILVSDDQNVEVGDVVAKMDDTSGSSSDSGKSSEPANTSAAPRVGGQPAASERPNPGGRQGSAKSSTPRRKAGGKSASDSSGADKRESSNADTTKKASATAEPAPEVGGQPMDAARPQPAGSPDVKAPSGGRAHLAFPPRRLEDGRRISDLPPQEAAQHTQRLSGATAEGQQQQQGSKHQDTTPSPQSTGSESEGVLRRRWAVGAPLPKDEDWQPAPGKWALSAAEMEMIDLGGADP